MTAHRKFDTIVLPSGIWLSVAPGDSVLRVSSYRHSFDLTTLRNHNNASNVELAVSPKPDVDEPRPLPRLKDADYVLVPVDSLTDKQRKEYYR